MLVASCDRQTYHFFELLDLVWFKVQKAATKQRTTVAQPQHFNESIKSVVTRLKVLVLIVQYSCVSSRSKNNSEYYYSASQRESIQQERRQIKKQEIAKPKCTFRETTPSLAHTRQEHRLPAWQRFLRMNASDGSDDKAGASRAKKRSIAEVGICRETNDNIQNGKCLKLRSCSAPLRFVDCLSFYGLNWFSIK